MILQSNNISAYLDPDTMTWYPQLMAQAFSLVYPTLDNETATGLAVAVASFESDIAGLLLPLAEASLSRDDNGLVSAASTRREFLETCDLIRRRAPSRM